MQLILVRVITKNITLFPPALELRDFRKKELVDLVLEEAPSLYLRWKFVVSSHVDKGWGISGGGSLLKHKSIYGKRPSKSINHSPKTHLSIL